MQRIGAHHDGVGGAGVVGPVEDGLEGSLEGWRGAVAVHEDAVGASIAIAVVDGRYRVDIARHDGEADGVVLGSHGNENLVLAALSEEAGLLELQGVYGDVGELVGDGKADVLVFDGIHRFLCSVRIDQIDRRTPCNGGLSRRCTVFWADRGIGGGLYRLYQHILLGSVRCCGVEIDLDDRNEVHGGLDADVRSRLMALAIKHVELVGLAFDEPELVEVDSSAHRAVLASEVQGELLIDEDPHIIVAAEFEGQSAHVLEGGLGMHGEVEVRGVVAGAIGRRNVGVVTQREEVSAGILVVTVVLVELERKRHALVGVDAGSADRERVEPVLRPAQGVADVAVDLAAPLGTAKFVERRQDESLGGAASRTRAVVCRLALAASARVDDPGIRFGKGGVEILGTGDHEAAVGVVVGRKGQRLGVAQLEGAWVGALGKGGQRTVGHDPGGVLGDALAKRDPSLVAREGRGRWLQSVHSIEGVADRILEHDAVGNDAVVEGKGIPATIGG